MKKLYKIFSIETREVCIPCEDYYHDGTNFTSEKIEYLDPYSQEFDTLIEAENELSTYSETRLYTILTIYIVK